MPNKSAGIRFTALAVVLLSVFALLGGVHGQSVTPLPLDEGSLTQQQQSILSAVRAQGQIEVIVGLSVPFRYANQASAQELADQNVTVQRARTNLLTRLLVYNVAVVSDSTSWVIPYVALRVDESALTALLTSTDVTSIDLNGRNDPILTSAEPVIHAPQVWAMGYTGSGQTVAIADSGVERTHPFLNNHVVSEACYSHSGSGSTSNCPNGTTSQTGTGAASPSKCFTNLSGTPATAEGCAHGTHVAGIAAGYVSTSFSGVAPNSNIIAINVFSKYTDPALGDFLTAFDTDIISGLNYVYAARTSYSIAAVNLSLGDYGRRSNSTCNSTSSSMTSIFQLLRSVGIAPVVATGNDHDFNPTNYISFPACISYAVSVGATTDADAVASFSNRSTIMTLFAPGVSITSSVPVGSVADPGGGYAAWNGTSMATPFVTGAFAVYRQFSPNSTVDFIVNYFRSTGQSIAISGGTIPRLNLEAAILASTPPSITTHPQSQTINSGQTAGLSVVATGTTPLSYQWYRGTAPDTSNPVGTNSPNYTTPALTTTTSYWVRVSNAISQVNSNTATITVNPPPSNVDTLGIYNTTMGWTSLVDTLTSPPGAGHYQTFASNAPVKGKWVMGDWNGDGQQTPGVYNNGAFFFTNTLGTPASWQYIWIGPPTVEVIAGRFDSGRTNDCIGVVIPGYAVGYPLVWTCDFSTVTPALTNHWIGLPLEVTTGDYQFTSGDWNNDGIDTIGVRRGPYAVWSNAAMNQSLAVWLNGQYLGEPRVGQYGQIVAGDWDGNSVDSFGLYYQDGVFLRRNDLDWNSGVFIQQNLGQPVGTPTVADSWRRVTVALTAQEVEPTVEPTAAETEVVPVEVTDEVPVEVTDEAPIEVTDEATPEEVATALPFPTLALPEEPTAVATEVVSLPTALPFPTLSVPEQPTAEPTVMPQPVPVAATMDDGAPDWQGLSGWTLTSEAAYGDAGLGWATSSSSQSDVLRWLRPLDLRSVADGSEVVLGFASRVSGVGSSASVQVSLDGSTWLTVGAAAAADEWQQERVDLSGYRGQLVWVQLVWVGAVPTNDGQGGGSWWVDNVSVTVVAASTPLPTSTVVPPTVEAPTATPEQPVTAITEEPGEVPTAEVSG